MILFSIPVMAQLPVTNGGTGASTASGARTNLGAAASGDNQDILSLDKVQQITMNPFSTPATPTGTLSAGGSLVNGTSYYAVVTALGSNYSIVGGVCVNGCTVLSTASAAVTATSVNKTITWNWTATAGAVAYILWSNTANTGFTRYVIVTTNSYVMTQFPTGFSTGTPPTVNTTGEIIAAKVPSLTVQQSAAAPNGAIDYEPLSGASSSCCITVNTNPFLQDANLGTGTELITLQDSPASTGQGMLFWSHSTSALFQFLTGTGAFAEFDSAGNLNFAGNTILQNTLVGDIGSTTGLVQINDTANVFTSGHLVSFDASGGTADSGLAAASTPSISATTPSATQIVCWKSSTQLGHCTTALVGVPPTCTCT